MLLCELKIISESVADRTFYHITLTRNIPKILIDGLIPKKGTRSRRLKEGAPAIYLFPTIEDAETAFGNWLGDEFSDNTRLALLKVTVPHTIELHSDVPFECHVYEPIPASCISVQSNDLGNEYGFDHLV